MKKNIGRSTWRQVGGDMSPDKYGAVIARYDGDAIEIREIQPVRAYVGDYEALDVGFPFWTREAYYYQEDLDLGRSEVVAALKCCDLDPSDVEPEHRAMAIAQALLTYGYGVNEGPAGWSKNVCPKRVRWWASERACGSSMLSDEDREFKALQREARKNRKAAS